MPFGDLMLCEGNGSHRSPAGMKTLRDSYIHLSALCYIFCYSGVREQPRGANTPCPILVSMAILHPGLTISWNHTTVHVHFRGFLIALDNQRFWMSLCSQQVAMASSHVRSPAHSADWSVIELTCPKSSLSCTLDLPFYSTRLVKKK